MLQPGFGGIGLLGDRPGGGGSSSGNDDMSTQQMMALRANMMNQQGMMGNQSGMMGNQLQQMQQQQQRMLQMMQMNRMNMGGSGMGSQMGNMGMTGGAAMNPRGNNSMSSSRRSPSRYSPDRDRNRDRSYEDIRPLGVKRRRDPPRGGLLPTPDEPRYDKRGYRRERTPERHHRSRTPDYDEGGDYGEEDEQQGYDDDRGYDHGRNRDYDDYGNRGHGRDRSRSPQQRQRSRTTRWHPVEETTPSVTKDMYDPAEPTAEEDDSLNNRSTYRSQQSRSHGDYDEPPTKKRARTPQRDTGGDLKVTLGHQGRIVQKDRGLMGQVPDLFKEQQQQQLLQQQRLQQQQQLQLQQQRLAAESQRYFCHACNTPCINKESFESHMMSMLHRQTMQQISSMAIQKTTQIANRIQEQQQQLQMKAADREDKSQGFCRTCDVYFNGTFKNHRRLDSHREMLIAFLRKGCMACNLTNFSNYAQFKAHVESDQHKKNMSKSSGDGNRKQNDRSLDRKTSRDNHQRERSPPRRSNEKNKIKTPEPTPPQRRQTNTDRSRIRDNRSRSERSRSYDRSGRTRPQPSRSRDTRLRDEKKSPAPSANRERETKQPSQLPSNKPQQEVPSSSGVAIGQEFIIPVSGFYCKLCHKFYSTEQAAKVIHCQSKSHYERMQSFITCQLTAPPKPPATEKTPTRSGRSRHGEARSEVKKEKEDNVTNDDQKLSMETETEAVTMKEMTPEKTADEINIKDTKETGDTSTEEGTSKDAAKETEEGEINEAEESAINETEESAKETEESAKETEESAKETEESAKETEESAKKETVEETTKETVDDATKETDNVDQVEETAAKETAKAKTGKTPTPKRGGKRTRGGPRTRGGRRGRSSKSATVEETPEEEPVAEPEQKEVEKMETSESQATDDNESQKEETAEDSTENSIVKMETLPAVCEEQSEVVEEKTEEKQSVKDEDQPTEEAKVKSEEACQLECENNPVDDHRDDQPKLDEKLPDIAASSGTYASEDIIAAINAQLEGLPRDGADVGDIFEDYTDIDELTAMADGKHSVDDDEKEDNPEIKIIDLFEAKDGAKPSQEEDKMDEELNGEEDSDVKEEADDSLEKVADDSELIEDDDDEVADVSEVVDTEDAEEKDADVSVDAQDAEEPDAKDGDESVLKEDEEEPTEVPVEEDPTGVPVEEEAPEVPVEEAVVEQKKPRPRAVRGRSAKRGKRLGRGK